MYNSQLKFFPVLCLAIILASPLSALACNETEYTLSNGSAKLILTEKQCATSIDYYITGPGGTAYLGSSSTIEYSDQSGGSIPPSYHQTITHTIEHSGELVGRWSLASSNANGFFGVLSLFQGSKTQGVFFGKQ